MRASCRRDREERKQCRSQRAVRRRRLREQHKRATQEAAVSLVSGHFTHNRATAMLEQPLCQRRIGDEHAVFTWKPHQWPERTERAADGEERVF